VETYVLRHMCYVIMLPTAVDQRFSFYRIVCLLHKLLMRWRKLLENIVVAHI